MSKLYGGYTLVYTSILRRYSYVVSQFPEAGFEFTALTLEVAAAAAATAVCLLSSSDVRSTTKPTAE